MAIVDQTRTRDEPAVHLSPSLQEIEALVSEYELGKVRLLRCFAAGWATRSDLRFVLPILAMAQDAARDGVALLTKRFGEATGGSAMLQVLDGIRGIISEGQAGLKDDLPRPPVIIPGFAKHFMQQCLQFCQECNATDAAAFLLASEIVAERTQAALADALTKADIAMLPAAGEFTPGQTTRAVEEISMQRGTGRAMLATGLRAVRHTLSLHMDFFEDLYSAMRFERTAAAFGRIQARASLENAAEPAIAMYPGIGEIMCEEQDDKRGIRFSVERYPCAAEVLDPRVVRIPPGKTNNRHKHAHETLFYFIEGTGRILVGETWVPVKPGDAVFAPRWAIHQTHNTGDTELVLLAITDYYLTSQVYVGSYDKI